MALVKCPNCDNMISDKATICPKCGAKIGFEQKLITCPECGEQYNIELGICPNCGCPAEVKGNEVNESVILTESGEKPLEKKKSKAGLVVLGLLFIGLAVLLAYVIRTSKISAYEDKVVEAIDLMYESGYESALLRDLTVEVWNNAIYHVRDLQTDKYVYVNGRFVYDFNDALYNLETSSYFVSKVKKINEDREKLAEIVSNLKPPKGYENIHESFISLYYAYKQISKDAIEPSGSLNSYSEDTIVHIDTFMALYKDLLSKVNSYFKNWSYS